MVSLCLPSDAFLQHLPSYLVFSYLGLRVSLQGCSSKAQPLLLTLGEGYLLTTAPLGPLARQWLSILKLQILQSRYKLLWMLLLARETAAFPVPLCPVTGTSSPNFSLLYFQVALMPGGQNQRDVKTDPGGYGGWAEHWRETDWQPLSPPHQRSKRKGTYLPPCPPIMPTQCAHRVWPQGGCGLQGPFLSPSVLSTAATPSFSELLLLDWHLPLPAAGTQASRTPIPEPTELETRHSPGERGQGPG